MILHAHAERGLPGYPWLVFLHGFAGDSLEWRAVGQAFGAYPRLYIDLPGHGGSADRAVNRFTDVSELIKNTLISYNMHKYWLVGYSLGGRGAMYYASQPHEGLCGLVVEGGHPGLAVSAAGLRLPGRSAACGAGCATQLQQRQGVSRDAAGLLTG